MQKLEAKPMNKIDFRNFNLISEYGHYQFDGVFFYVCQFHLTNNFIFEIVQSITKNVEIVKNFKVTDSAGQSFASILLDCNYK